MASISRPVRWKAVATRFQAMNYDNLFLLGNGPIQLLNALEAANHFLDKGALPSLVISNRKHRSPEAQQKLIDLREWGQVLWVEPESEIGMTRPPLRNLRMKHHTLRMHRLLRPYQGCRRFFLAQYTEFNRHLCAWLRPQEIIYLTDGMEISRLFKKREKALEIESTSSRERLHNRLRWTFYGWDASHPDSMTIFSALRPQLVKNDQFVKNDYSFICSQFGDKLEVRDAVAFIRQPHYPKSPHNGFCYPDYWQRIKQMEVTEYWPHPKEYEDEVTKQCKSLGIEVRTSPFPIEVAFLESGCPRTLVSVCSTALYTCKTVFGSLGVEAYYLETGKELEEAWKHDRAFLRGAGVEAYEFA